VGDTSLPFRPERPTVAEVAAGALLVAPSTGELFVLHQRADDRWCFPKGHVERGESALEAARREIVEESGLAEFTLEEELGAVTYRYYDEKRDLSVVKTSIYFLGYAPHAPLQLESGFDAGRWVASPEARALLRYDNERELVSGVERRWAARGGSNSSPR
jgi:bis(5'-nucleosidyl)-tetraphosphatase